MTARVAVAIAAFNDAVFARFCLEALALQTFRDFEVVFVDDGSVDDTAAVAESFADRITIRVIRAAHAGRQAAKQAACDAVDAGAKLLLMLDADIELPADALSRMVQVMDSDGCVGVVSAHARSNVSRPFGRGQAFMEDAFLYSNTTADGSARWIVGGCAMFRREARVGIDVRVDLPDDSHLAQQLRGKWRLALPRDLVAVHHGVPTTLRGVLRRGYRDGVRVRAMLRHHPDARQVGNVARLVPLPLMGGVVTGAITLQPWLVGCTAAATAAYLVAFLVATRKVPAVAIDRLAGAAVFTLGNLGFGVGYIEEALRDTPFGLAKHRSERTSEGSNV